MYKDNTLLFICCGYNEELNIVFVCVCFLHPAQSSGNVQFWNERLVQDTEENQQKPEKNLVRGQTYKLVPAGAVNGAFRL